MIVGEAPGKTEDRLGIPFCGISGHFLDLFLSRAFLSRQRVYVTNLVKLRPPGNDDPEPADIARDWPILKEEIAQVQPKIIVAVGKVAFQNLTGLSLNMDITHGKLWPAAQSGGLLPPGTPVFCVYHPADGLRSPRTMEQCYWDFQQLGLRNSSFPPSLDAVDYKIMRSAEDAIAFQDAFPGRRPFGCDTEGTWDEPISIQISPAPGVSRIIMADNWELIYWFNEYIIDHAEPMVFHYAPHDLEVLQYGFWTPVRKLWTPRRRFTDTAQEGYLSRQEPIGIGLKPMALRHLGLQLQEYKDVVGRVARERWKKLAETTLERHRLRLPPQYTKTGKLKKKQKEYEFSDLGKRLNAIFNAEAKKPGSVDWTKRMKAVRRDFPECPRIERTTLADVPKPEFVAYAGADPDATLQVHAHTSKEVVRTQQQNVLEADLGALPMFARMNHVGMMVDVGELNELEADFRSQMDFHRIRLNEAAGYEVDPDKTAELRDLLYSKLRLRPPYRTPTGLPSTDEEALSILQQKIGNDEQIVEVFSAIMDFRESAKHLRTYVLPLYGKIRHVGDAYIDGSISPDLLLTNTATGRAAGVFLTFPSHTEDGKRIRRAFKARRGTRFISVDLSQIEMRVMAALADDENMIGAFQDKKDIHCMSAARMFHIPEEQVLAEKAAEDPTHRFPAKTVGFALIYGATAQGIQRTLSAPPPQGAGLQYTVEEAQQLIDDWLDVFPRVREFFRRQARLARKDGFIRGLSGRLRYFPLIWHPEEYYRAEAARGGTNHPIQEGAQYIEKVGMRIWWENYEGKLPYYCEPVLQIHDELIFEVAANRVEEAARTVEESLIAAAEKVLPQVPVTADWHHADNWGDLK